MRKRKSPIVLVTALTVLVVGLVGYQFASSRPNAPTPEQPAAPPVSAAPDTLGEKRAPVDANSVASAVGSQMGGAPSGGKPTAVPIEGGPGAPGAGPMILNPAAATAAPQKPKPNATSTSTQWYNDESANGSKKD